jgi:nucleosome binding factor SPN SPT16 subunit
MIQKKNYLSISKFLVDSKLEIFTDVIENMGLSIDLQRRNMYTKFHLKKLLVLEHLS